MIEPVAHGLVQGCLHLPPSAFDTGLVLAHGAGSDGNARLLVAVATAFAHRGVAVLRIDLPFRQERRTGPPHPSRAARDRAGIREACEWMRTRGGSKVVLGGHSYGGRQASMLAAEDPAVADALLLLSYPLHPPRKPEQMRTAHFADLRVPAVFIHGTKDPFGTPEEMRAALPTGARLILLEGAGHELRPLLKSQQSVLDAVLNVDNQETSAT